MILNNIHEKYTEFLMDKEKEDLYNIEKYNEDELFQMLDLNNPTDRELEAKLLFTIEKYSELDEPEAKQIHTFFEDAYKYFFENDEEINNTNTDTLIEGMEAVNSQEDVKQPNDPTQLRNNTDTNLIQTTELKYGASKLNPVQTETQQRILHLDSQFRNYDRYPSSTDYLINLSEVLNNVVALRLHSVSIPYTWYNISNVYNANYFRLIGNSDGITGVYDLKFEIPAGTYNTLELIEALNKSIDKVKLENADINFGTTSVIHDNLTSKITFIIDIQQIYNETNFFLYFGKITNAFDDRVRSETIPGFLGFANMVIPRFQSSNTISSTPIVSVPNTYSLESIYSNFRDSLDITGKTTAAGVLPIEYNSFDPDAVFYLVIHDNDNTSTNGAVGNNHFTIYNYEGPGEYVPAGNVNSSVILDKIKVEFGDVSGLYTRATLLQLINRALLSNTYLSNNACLHKFDISYNDANDAITTLQRFQMTALLNRETTVKKENSKTAVVFPDEEAVYAHLTSQWTDPIVALSSWTGPLWTGKHSCFLFEDNIEFTSPNSVSAETSPVQTLYDIVSAPVLTLRCTKTGYNNASNNRQITVGTSTATGNTGGYILNDYIGVYNNQEAYLTSEINTQFKNITDVLGDPITNGYVNAKAFYDVTLKRSRIQFDILTYFNEYDYTLDLTSSILSSFFTNPINITLPDSNNLISASPTTPTITFPYTVTSLNNTLTVKPTSTIIPTFVNGLSAILPYTITFPTGIYRTPIVLQRMINNTFLKIQGETDSSGNLLYGLNMSQSKVEITETTFTFYYRIVNKITQDDYIVELTDMTLDTSTIPPTPTSIPYTDYENNYYDLSGNERYSVESTTDALGNTILSYSDPDAVGSGVPSGITGTSWNAFLGFTDVSYSLSNELREITGSRDIMYDISKTMIVNQEIYDNHAIFFTPQSSVKGLTDSNGVKKIEIDVPDGIYTVYGLYNVINYDLSNNPITTNTRIYSTFDKSIEYAVLKMCINMKYTAEDYILQFFDQDTSPVQNVACVTSNSIRATTWDVTIGWILGFRHLPLYNLNRDIADSLKYASSNNYTIDDSTDIITIEGDSCLDIHLFKNLYLIVDDYTQNHLNDGLITGVRNNANADNPSYVSNATRVCNPLTSHNQASIFNASQPGMGLTEKQLYAANQIGTENKLKNSTKLYSDPPYVKDMFALIPLKISSLTQGEMFVENGGTLQDNNRKYFGPVNIVKLRIQLLNDHGDVININGSNWSFSFAFDYLYDLKGI
jgi:hypothetical protein